MGTSYPSYFFPRAFALPPASILKVPITVERTRPAIRPRSDTYRMTRTVSSNAHRRMSAIQEIWLAAGDAFRNWMLQAA